MSLAQMIFFFVFGFRIRIHFLAHWNIYISLMSVKRLPNRTAVSLRKNTYANEVKRLFAQKVFLLVWMICAVYAYYVHAYIIKCELLCVKKSKRAQTKYSMQWRWEREWVCDIQTDSVCITYECGFISFQETLREKESESEETRYL